VSEIAFLFLPDFPMLSSTATRLGRAVQNNEVFSALGLPLGATVRRRRRKEQLSGTVGSGPRPRFLLERDRGRP
jgi:hypothetical protein